ncbi:acyl-CoA N-acyltransferase [Martensiomyces pterosporus]|nr:acyl-CoA N-acyltransferase [Martensiomyces pterosporus]
MELTASDLAFRILRSEDEVRQAYPLEVAGYSEDEAASLDGMLYRFRHARHLFLGAFDKTGAIVGYIMSTQAAAPLVTHESMSTHDPSGTTVCVHSVCVDQRWQGKGVASKLLRLYTELIREHNSGSSTAIRRIAMLSRANLVPFYERAGYKCLGQSSVVHGDEKWYDCVIDL